MKDKNFIYVDVLAPIPIDAPLIYKTTPNNIPQKGARVLVPLKDRKFAIGICYGLTDTNKIKFDSLRFEIKSIYEIIDVIPVFSASFMNFLEWASKYYCYPLGLVYRDVLPSDIFSSTQKAINLIVKNLKKNPCKSSKNPDFIKWSDNIPILTDEQSICLDKISDAIGKKNFIPFLLHGVTGSGKTEIYINAAKKCMESGKNVLIMVPEIAMTTQIVSRFLNRFNKISVYHSGLTKSQKLSAWKDAQNNETPVIIGARSAIFAPLQNIGLIIVDEEHDSSYKQDHGFRYNARDLAIVRARQENCAVILGTATPSISSNYNASTGKYSYLALTKRVGKAGFPSVNIINKKDISEKNYSFPDWLSQSMFNSIEETLKNNEQVIVFLNKRGFSTFIYCHDCGYVFTCNNCSVTYTWHKSKTFKNSDIKTDGILKCHYCGDEKPSLPLCPRCKSQTINAKGYGTERISSDLSLLFPSAIIDRLDRDNVSTQKKLEAVLDKFKKNEINILVGTQMITKGHDFPNLTLVCIVMADFSFNIPEYNAAEKAFQLISQVAGRSGRFEKSGKALIQTYNPDNSVIQLAINQNYKEFYNYEISKRQKYGYPPYEKIFLIIFSGTNESKVKEISFNALQEIEKIKKIDIFYDIITLFGPSPSPIEKILNRFRWQIMIKIKSPNLFLRFVEMTYKNFLKLKKGSVRIEFDIDPVNML